MAETPPEKSFLLQKDAVKGPSRQPLELYHLSHDLRGPLNSILGFAELLAEGIEGPLNEIQTEDINAIHQSAQKLLGLINTVVDLSKLEAGRLVLSPGPVQLEYAVKRVLANAAAAEKAEQGLLTFTVPDLFPEIHGELERIGQMLLNLVLFAFEVKQVTRVKVTATYNEQTAIIAVTAVQGVLSPEQLEGIFDLAVEVDVSGRSKLGQGGLEMPLTKKLAQAHNGNVWAESRAETGTTFVLQLPLQQPA